MNKIKISIFSIVIGCSAFNAIAQTADEIIQKHIDAVGGAKNWEKVKSIKLSGSINLGGMEADLDQTVINDKGVRMDISVAGQKGYLIYTPVAGWMYMPFAGITTPQEVPQEMLKTMQDRMNFNNQLLANKSSIAKSTYSGMDTINHVSCYKLNITAKNGDEQTCYIDGSTYYLVRTEIKANIQGEDQVMAINFSDFKKQPEGITIPMSIGSPQGDLTFKSVAINKNIDEKILVPEGKK